MSVLLTQKLPMYSALLRLGKPTGTLLLLWPCWWGALAASNHTIPLAEMVWLALGALVMRSAGCVINDLWDKDIDARISRTCQRPLACGALSPRAALLVLGGLLALGFVIALQLPPAAMLVAIAVLPLVLLYPLAKRYTRYPQLVLAVTMNWGVWVGWYSVTPTLSITAIFLYIAAVFWTMAYDTLYAYQDRLDDAKINLGSMAVAFGDRGVHWISRFYTGMAVFLFLALFSQSANLLPYAGIGLLIGAALALTQHQPFQTSPAVAARLFNTNALLGAFITLIIGTL